jgi:AraC family transcriptional regulator, regulatory protein of adaptative response / DNA-3-methyladenine glycosylase II
MTSGLTQATEYRAVLKRDKKYDGIFYFAVKATGVYCRPSCPAQHPLQKDYSFFTTVEEAQSEGYQACKRCHPARLKHDLSTEILGSIDAGELNDKGVHGLADSLHISERHLRRLVQDRTGDSPLHLNKAKRLSAARLLILRTKLPIIDVAFIAEFSSLRQFNDVFKGAFKISPSEMRKTAKPAFPASSLSH